MRGWLSRKRGASREAIARVISSRKGARTAADLDLCDCDGIVFGGDRDSSAIPGRSVRHRRKEESDIFSPTSEIISVITRAGFLGKAVERFGEARLSRIGLVMLAAGLASYPFVHNFALLAITVALVPLGTAFTFPCVTSLLSRVIPSSERGLYMGVQQTYRGLIASRYPAVGRILVRSLWAARAVPDVRGARPLHAFSRSRRRRRQTCRAAGDARQARGLRTTRAHVGLRSTLVMSRTPR